ncbi:unnamed protein product [Dicrocoelium dendriticum]|nr:unnamed protein product [Dicrocoelium dendriticum]
MVEVEQVYPYFSSVHCGNGSTLRSGVRAYHNTHEELIRTSRIPERADCSHSRSHPDRFAQLKTPTSTEMSPFSSDSSRVSTPSVNGNQVASDYVSRKAKRISRLYSDQSSFIRFQALEVEPAILDYLVVHGALSESVSKQILCADRHQGRSLLLASLGLPSPEDTQCAAHSPNSNFSTGLALLLNALRHTGHHSLASFLDCGRRITPLTTSDSVLTPIQGETDGSTPRRRGQLSVWIRLEAIKVNPDEYHEFASQVTGAGDSDYKNGSNNPLSSEPHPNGIRPTYVPVLPSFVEYLQLDKSPSRLNQNDAERATAPTVSVWIDHTSPLATSDTGPKLIDPTDRLPEMKIPRRPVGCFARLRSLLHHTRKLKKQTKSSTVNPILQSAVEPTPGDLVAVPTNASSATPLSGASGEHTASVKGATTATKLALLVKKSGEFYSTLLDPSSALRDSIVRYFEQSCEVLVLDSRLAACPLEQVTDPNLKNTDLAVQVLVVATRSDLVQRLSDACKPNMHLESTTILPPAVPFPVSRLANELRQIIIQSGALSFLKLQDLRLYVGLDSNEVCIAIEELNDLVE